jgi:phospholipid-binding lipoprotein MlaA
LRRSFDGSHAVSAVLGCAVLALVVSGCSTMSGMLRADAPLLASQQAPDPSTRLPSLSADSGMQPGPVGVSVQVQFGQPRADALDGTRVAGGDDEAGSALAQAPKSDKADADSVAIDEEYDPWESFNEKMFTFNRNLDRYILKPVARAWNVVVPEPVQVMVSNGFENINFVPRVVNNLLQAKWGGATRELSRFVINSTAGVGGLFDPAKDYWGIQKSKEDFGQTLGVWGSGPGPYLILPLMEPMTVRDGIGKAVDGFMDPLSYVLPFFWDRLLMKIVDTVNDRALNYDLYQGFEESVIDMYSAVRHGYLQRREKLIQE